ncbi:MAG: ATP-binding cassette domain-containing protein, partial [Paracraurococcus sp.]
GKMTPIRGAAGLVPLGGGRIRRPARAETLLLPQRPYLPLGTLRAAVCYPAGPGEVDTAAIVFALTRCGLGGLAARLDEAGRWDRILSLGEQQRLGFARLLLLRPRWALLDEATSALDEIAEAGLMRLFEQELAGVGLVSTGDRPGLARWHDRVLRIEEGRLIGAAAAALPPLPAPGRLRVAHAHALPEQRPAARPDRQAAPARAMQGRAQAL